MSRDIVQFVPLRQFQRQGPNFSLVSCMTNELLIVTRNTLIFYHIKAKHCIDRLNYYFCSYVRKYTMTSHEQRLIVKGHMANNLNI